MAATLTPAFALADQQARRRIDQAEPMNAAGSIEACGALRTDAKAMSCVETNLQALLDYAQAPLHDLPEALRLRGDGRGELASPRQLEPQNRKIEAFSIFYLKFRVRNARPVRICHAALHLNLRCVAQNCHVMGVICQVPDEGRSQ
jgi:hypothetical protein